MTDLAQVPIHTSHNHNNLHTTTIRTPSQCQMIATIFQVLRWFGPLSEGKAFFARIAQITQVVNKALIGLARG
jgi:hypothetical protein